MLALSCRWAAASHRWGAQQHEHGPTAAASSTASAGILIPFPPISIQHTLNSVYQKDILKIPRYERSLAQE